MAPGPDKEPDQDPRLNDYEEAHCENGDGGRRDKEVNYAWEQFAVGSQLQLGRLPRSSGRHGWSMTGSDMNGETHHLPARYSTLNRGARRSSGIKGNGLES